MKESLFKEFPEVSAEDWKLRIQKDLRGEDYERNLIFKTLDEISIQPFYTAKDVRENKELPPPGSWSISERILVDSAATGNRQIKEALEKGAESLWLFLSSKDVDLNVLFEGVELKDVQVFFNLKFLSEEFIDKMNASLKGQKGDFFLQIDPIRQLTKEGNFFFNQKKDFEILKSIKSRAKGFISSVSVDVSLYQNAGANIPQQLGYALAHLDEYLHYLSQKGENLEELQPQFILATGSNYFLEIAKIRALRQLFNSLAQTYSIKQPCFILASPGTRNKTIYDYNVNLLRTTTECMSAVLGGVDAVTNLSYDFLFRKESDFGRRISRNQLLILKHEAYFNKVSNPADGSYYIESLTSQFIDAALKIFEEIKTKGGFLKHLENGEIQRRIEKSAAREQELFDKGDLILIGTNKYLNSQEKMHNILEFDPFENPASKDTLITPIPGRRLSAAKEQERLKKESIES
ncbi:methylmalonyl-CoA mutase subunit beta [Salinimicrobium sp. HB62]|uniref:methylmalonyl-CoA mutase subunit beta n=1 Tax=Salinimicrobium sp. HB62 TaxID=3077781 RepID=UPI002D77D8FC|nr:methylmalonyl-CoA mutase subunit beta [Salinimicrobium sp. HB62]